MNQGKQSKKLQTPESERQPCKLDLVLSHGSLSQPTHTQTAHPP